LDPKGNKTIAECEEEYEDCLEVCRSITGRRARIRKAICYADCMAAYSTCLATAEETLTVVGVTVLVCGVVYLTGGTGLIIVPAL
jgi:hypothetical protein